MNSLLILLLTPVFIGLGYAFIVRRFNHSYSDKKFTFNQSLTRVFIDYGKRLFSTRSNHLIFVVIACTLSLYWGWSPAILWITIGALFINFNLQTLLDLRLNKPTLTNNRSLSSWYFTEHTQRYKAIGFSILRAFSALACLLLIILSSELLSQHSGVAVAIITLGFAIRIWQHYANSAIGRIASVIIAGIGLLVSDKMGLYFIGSWQPISQFPELVIDERWVFALLIALLFSKLRESYSTGHDRSISDFLNYFSRISGYLSSAIIFIALIFLCVKRPLIDAPLRALSEDTSHYLFGIILIMLVGASNLLQYLQNACSDNTKKAFIPQSLHQHETVISSFSHSHRKVFFEIFSLIVLIVLLATSNGIGAWSSHFLQWNPEQTLISHINLMINALTHVFTELGIEESVSKNGLAIVLTLNALTLLSKLIGIQSKLSDAFDETVTNSSEKNGLSKLAFYALLGLLLLFGATINTWLLLGCLALSGISLILLCDSHFVLDQENNSHPNQRSNPTTLISASLLAGLTVVQLMIQCWLWWSDMDILYALSAAILLICFILMLIKDGAKLRQKLAEKQEINPLSLDES